MQGFLAVCPGGHGESGDASFVRKFEDQRDSEVDTEWRANYADARELLDLCADAATADLPDEEETGGTYNVTTLLEKCWETSFTRCSGAFSKQLNLHRANWESLRKLLDRYEEENEGNASEQAQTVLHVLRKAAEDHYRGLLKLQAFQYWHTELFGRAKQVAGDAFNEKVAGQKWWDGQAGLDFRNARLLLGEMKPVVVRYARFVSHTNADVKGKRRGALSEFVTVEQADALLSARRMHTTPPSGVICLFGMSCGVIVTFLMMLVFLLFFADPVAGYDSDKHLYDVVPYFRGYLVIYIAIWLWGLVLYRMGMRRINHPYLLNLSGETAGPLDILMIAAALTALSLGCLTLYLAEVKCGLHLIPFFRDHPRSYILINAVVPPVLLLNPFHVMRHSTRAWLCKVLMAILITPVLPCTFEGNFITDYLTSLVKPITDVSLTVCTLVSGKMLQDPLLHNGATCNANNTVWLPSLCALMPLMWRFLQCARRALLEPLFLNAKVRPTPVRRLREEETESPLSLLGSWKVQETGTVFTVGRADSSGAVEFRFFGENAELAFREVRNGRSVFECELSGIDRPAVRGRTSARRIEIMHKTMEEDVLAGVEVTCTIDSEEYRKTMVATRYEPRSGRRPVVWPHLMNMFKYLFSIIPVVIGFWHSDWKKHETQGWPIGRVVYVFLLLFSTAYSYSWDVFMDWGLWKQDTFPPRSLVGCCCGLVWRNTAVDFRSKWFFGLVMLYNLIGRLAWTFTLVADPNLLGLKTSTGDKEMLTFITSFIEVCRRSSWGLIRLGHEHEVDVGDWSGSADGGRSVPPLMSKTPWIKSGEVTALHTLIVSNMDSNAEADVELLSNSSFTNNGDDLLLGTSRGFPPRASIICHNPIV